MIFDFCRAASGVTIWHIAVLRTSIWTVDIGLFGDEATVATPNRGTRLDEQPLGKNLIDTVEQAQYCFFRAYGFHHD